MRPLAIAAVMLAASQHWLVGADEHDDDGGDHADYGDTAPHVPQCSQLHRGQYYCSELSMPPHLRHVLCPAGGTVDVRCAVAPGVDCVGLRRGGNQSDYFVMTLRCAPAADRDWHVALLLSVFGGWLGLDRLYLGYVASGLFKMFTFGCFLLWHLVDIVLIALQILEPADGLGYAMNDMAPRHHAVHLTNSTYFS